MTTRKADCDIHVIIEALRKDCPAITVEQLQVSHPADDDGIWFFAKTESPVRVQLESSSGNCPFVIETNSSDERIMVESVDKAMAVVRSLLGC